MRAPPPQSVEELSTWFLIKYAFWLEVISRTESVPFIHHWALQGIGKLLRPLPVRLRNEILEGSTKQQ